MTECLFEQTAAAISAHRIVHPVGRVVSASGGRIAVEGLGDRVKLGDRARILSDVSIRSEVIKLIEGRAIVLPEGPVDGVCVGDMVRIDPPAPFRPHMNWIGRVIDPDGNPLDGRALLPGTQKRPLQASPPAPNHRRAMGERLPTGLAVFDTLLPLAKGQRIGLFAGSGVGKSTLLGNFAKGVQADVIVIALVGERGREVRDFVETVLGEEGLARSVVVAATSDRAPQIRRRCAWAAMSVAEFYRDQGLQVLLLVDSVTRFAEAHRELAVAGGEPASLRGYPASTGPAIASLCERAGPGEHNQGDITAVFSVLVAGSDMDEPVADMLRGVLDGHVVLDREIAERGRFPAVDLLRSVSRSLPSVATDTENALISTARSTLGSYDRSELMIQSGLYVSGTDPKVDEAIQIYPQLDAFIGMAQKPNITASFAELRRALHPTSQR
ncbi:FliI/YscN family ATPase [Aestuariibius sp. HNIBRBA575]|uniref:FliI/YscN family ATPase n=1 Tax=Aestuariibius sp. HNIBRBA575 TaxID=3233343 RepID=UPI0034A2C0E2